MEKKDVLTTVEMSQLGKLLDIQEKSSIRETLTLSACADSSNDTKKETFIINLNI